MLLRRITQHVKAQNWFAVAIDFVIVIVGVFIGIQVANWNDERVKAQTETELLVALRAEITASIDTTNARVESYTQVADAAKRSLKFLATNEACNSDCWVILVDFMHASQWQPVNVARSTFDNMRRVGLPKDQNIVEKIETYLGQNDSATATYAVLPYYRDLVRQLVPIEAQEVYWKTCWSSTDDAEYYNLNCPKGVSDQVSSASVEKIAKHPEIQPYLTQWTGHVLNLPSAMDIQINSAKAAIEAIDAELGRR